MRLSKEIINKIIDRKKYLVIELEQILLLRAGPVPQKRRPCRLLTMETVVQTFSQCGREYSCVNYTEKKKLYRRLLLMYLFLFQLQNRQSSKSKERLKARKTKQRVRLLFSIFGRNVERDLLGRVDAANRTTLFHSLS